MELKYPKVNTLEFEDQLKQIGKMASKMSKELGYVPLSAYREQAKKGNLILLTTGVNVVGFCNYNIRKKDNVGVIYEIAVHPAMRGKAGGKKMIEEVLTKCNVIELKCPIDNASNNFYNKIGIKLDTIDGKKRQLNVWQITNKTVKDKQ